MMQNKSIFKHLLILCMLSLNLYAIEGKIKVFIPSQETIYTSQKITVAVELLSSAFSITDARITFPASKKYIIQAPQSASYLGQEEVDGEDWQMVHYDYEVYALQAGKIEIPSISVSFTASMGYGQPKKEFILQSDSLHFEVKSPEGVNPNQFILVTDNYTLKTEMKPEKHTFIMGDAVELSVSQKANDIPDILLRPVIYKSNAFVRVYNKEPELKSGLKGDYDVSRTDRFTFVASGEGNVTIPKQELLWWNSVTKKVQVETIPEISLEIIPDPQIAIDAKKAQQKERLIFIIITLFIFFILYKIFGIKIRVYMNERKRIYSLSEKGRFQTLLKCCHDSSVSNVYHALYAWLEVADPALSRAGFKGICEVQPSFSKMLHALEIALALPQKSIDRTAFIDELQKLRNMLLNEQHVEVEGLSRTINPN